MKKYFYILSFCALFFSISSFAAPKTYTLSTHLISVTKVDTNPGTYQIQLTNVTSSSINIKWTMLENTFPFSGWTFNFCDLNTCYTGNIPQNATDIVGANSPAAFSVTVSSYHLVKGSAILQVALYDVNNPTAVDTVTFEVFAQRLGIENITIPSSSISIFPNPSSNYVYIQSLVSSFSPVKAVIMNIEGKIISEYVLSPGNAGIPVFDLPSGMYFISLRDQSGMEAVKEFVKE